MGCSEVVRRVVEDLKDESEPYRRMVMETIDKVPPQGLSAARLACTAAASWAQ